jgi:hypothetical protein
LLGSRLLPRGKIFAMLGSSGTREGQKNGDGHRARRFEVKANK